jgi:hypothetical protein
MADQSNFSKYPKKILVYISGHIIDNGFEWQDLNNDYEEIYNDYESILQNVANFVGETITEEDVQFFAKFIEINDDLLSQIFETNDKSLMEQLKIPQANDYSVEYSVNGSCTFTEYHESKFSSYDKDWVFGSLNQQHNDGNWDIYSGVLKDTSYDNWEINDWDIDEVKEINNTQESRDPRKLLENTEKLIPKLDRQTLVRLKYLINKELRGF